jgi:hypothetical protein
MEIIVGGLVVLGILGAIGAIAEASGVENDPYNKK